MKNRITGLMLWILTAAGLLSVFVRWLTGMTSGPLPGAAVFAAQFILSMLCGSVITLFLYFILRRDRLLPAVKFAVKAFFAGAALYALLIFADTGQPLRFWKSFSFAGTESFTSVSPALLVYVFMILSAAAVLFTAVPFMNKNLSEDSFRKRLLWIPASASVFLCFFMEGSSAILWNTVCPVPVNTGLLFTAGAMSSFAEGCLLLVLVSEFCQGLRICRREFDGASVYLFSCSLLLSGSTAVIMLLNSLKIHEAWPAVAAAAAVQILSGIICICLMRSQSGNKSAAAVSGLVSALSWHLLLFLYPVLPVFPWNQTPVLIPSPAEVLITAGAVSSSVIFLRRGKK